MKNMSLIDRIGNALFRTKESTSIDAAAKTINQMIENKQLPTTAAYEEKAVPAESTYSYVDQGALPAGSMNDVDETSMDEEPSRLRVRRTQHNLASAMAYSALARWFSTRNGSVPGYDDPARDIYLSQYWRDEPIMAGAVYSMTAKMMAMRWSVSGRRLPAKRAARILAEAEHMDGYDWGGFISSVASDFYTCNRGAFIETAKTGDSLYGPLAALGHIDALACTLTGNRGFPVWYVSETTGQQLRFRQGQFIHFASLPSARERHLGQGTCAADRAFRSIQIMMGLHQYDSEKLSNLPPEGVASVTGLTKNEFSDALEIWKAAREQNRMYTFPQVLWLLSSQPNTTVDVKLQGFSQLPEAFNRQEVMTHYISTLALCFGVDTREFWPISSGAMGTASESEIQHIKAKGKGPGEFISTVERHINGEFPEDTSFGFDTMDMEEDKSAATVAKMWVDAFYPLYTGLPAGKSKASPSGKPNTEAMPNAQEIGTESASGQAMTRSGAAKPVQKAAGLFGAVNPADSPQGQGVEQIITKDQILRLLAEKHVIPEWMLNDERTSIADTDIHLSKEGEVNDNDETVITWENGILKEHRPMIVLNYPVGTPGIPVAERVKEFPDVRMKAAQAKLMNSLQDTRTQILDSKRNIKGAAIPDAEVLRGSAITRNTLKTELDIWRNNPILAPYAPTEAEVDGYIKRTLGA